MKDRINSGEVDFGRQSSDYALHRPGFPESFYERVTRACCDLQGIAALDVATGPGVIAIELAKRGASVLGIDISKNQIDAAQALAHSMEINDRCDFQVSAVEKMPFLENSFDLVTAGQCWHWFDEKTAIKELKRVMKPGAFLIIANYNYLARLCDVAKETEKLVLKFNPQWTMAGNTGLYPGHIDSLSLAGFRLIEQFCYDHERVLSHIAWRGRMRTCNGVGSGHLTEDEIADFDLQLAHLLNLKFSDPLQVRHRVWATIFQW